MPKRHNLGGSAAIAGASARPDKLGSVLNWVRVLVGGALAIAGFAAKLQYNQWQLFDQVTRHDVQLNETAKDVRVLQLNESANRETLKNIKETVDRIDRKLNQ